MCEEGALDPGCWGRLTWTARTVAASSSQSEAPIQGVASITGLVEAHFQMEVWTSRVEWIVDRAPR